MQFLIQHWHCIFPLAGMIVGFILFRGPSGEKKSGDEHSTFSRKD